MSKLTRIGVLSCGKFMGVMYGVLGFVFGAIFSLLALTGAAVSQEQQAAGWIAAVMGMGAVVVLPIVYGIMGFIGGILMALLFNLVAGWMGGLEIQIAETRPATVQPETSPPPIPAG